MNKLICPECKAVFDITDVIEEIERKAIYRFVDKIIRENEDAKTTTKEAV